MALTVDNLILELGQMCGQRGELDPEVRIDLLASLETTLIMLDTARLWRYQLATGMFLMHPDITGTTKAVNAPTYDAGTGLSTITAMAGTTPFKLTDADTPGRSFTFDGSGNSYPLSSVTSTSVIVVVGDASGEGASKAFTINGLTEYDWDTVNDAALRGLGKVIALYYTDPIDCRITLKDKEFYREHLLPMDASAGRPEIYWETGERTFSIWPKPSEDILCYVDYVRHHGSVGEDTTIFFPEKWKTVLLRMARQVFKSQIQTIDKMMESDSVLGPLYQQMVADQTSKDRSGRPGIRGNTWGVRVTHDYPVGLVE